MSIGQSLRAARRKKDLTQAQLAKKIGVSKAYYSAWEKDRHAPHIDMLVCIADVLDISLDELVGRRTSNR